MVDHLEAVMNPPLDPELPSRVEANSQIYRKYFLPDLFPAVAAKLSRMLFTFEFFWQRFRESRRLAGIQDVSTRTQRWLATTVIALKRIKELGRQHGFRFVTFYFETPKIDNILSVGMHFDFPTANALDKITPLVEFGFPELSNFLTSNGIEHFSFPEPACQECQLKGDYHFSAVGTQAVADALYERRSFYLSTPPRKPAGQNDTP